MHYYLKLICESLEKLKSHNNFDDFCNNFSLNFVSRLIEIVLHRLGSLHIIVCRFQTSYNCVKLGNKLSTNRKEALKQLSLCVKIITHWLLFSEFLLV